MLSVSVLATQCPAPAGLHGEGGGGDGDPRASVLEAILRCPVPPSRGTTAPAGHLTSALGSNLLAGAERHHPGQCAPYSCPPPILQREHRSPWGCWGFPTQGLSSGSPSPGAHVHGPRSAMRGPRAAGFSTGVGRGQQWSCAAGASRPSSPALCPPPTPSTPTSAGGSCPSWYPAARHPLTHPPRLRSQVARVLRTNSPRQSTSAWTMAG